MGSKEKEVWKSMSLTESGYEPVGTGLGDSVFSLDMLIDHP